MFFPSGEGDITQDEDQLKERLPQIKKRKIQIFLVEYEEVVCIQ